MTWSAPTTTAWSSCPATRRSGHAAQSTARIAKEDETRRRLRAGELGLDLYGLRDKLAELGVEYVDVAGGMTRCTSRSSDSARPVPLFAADLSTAGVDVTGFDPAPVATPEGVGRCPDVAAAVADADIVLIVTGAAAGR